MKKEIQVNFLVPVATMKAIPWPE